MMVTIWTPRGAHGLGLKMYALNPKQANEQPLEGNISKVILQNR
jgi:hypothetical protein